MDYNYHAVLDALTKASSQNTELLKDAERKLKYWETQPGFYSILLNIATDRTLDVNIRWLSVLCTKNGVDCHWRIVISDEEKSLIKQKLLHCVNEPINQIALQLAVIISKIARYEFPSKWQELFPTLLYGMQSTDQLYQLRALLTMHHVIKTLASKRLTYDRRIFQQLTATIFSDIFHQWINFSKLFLEEVPKDISKSSQWLESSFLSLKILRKLIVYGFKDCSKEADAINFLSLIFQQIGPFLDCRSALENRTHLLEICEKYLVLLIKVLHDVLDIQPFSFVQFIRPALECSVTICFSKNFQGRLFERLIVQFLNLIKAILTCVEYKLTKSNEETKTYPATVESDKVKSEFFTLPVLTEICQQLFTRYFLLTENDLNNWENNPEEFASEEIVESWKFSLRPCTEVFFLALFHEFRDLLIPFVIEMTRNIQNNGTNDLMSILKKEAAYNVVGLAAFDLYDEIDFDSWFTNVLIPELRIKSTGYYIIRRRVIWLIGQWVGVKMSTDLRPLLYEVILQLLNDDENLVVRLAAAKTLKVAVDDFEFIEEQFLPFLENAVSSLFMLLQEVKESDLKMTVLHVLSFIIERMKCEVHPHINSLMQYLPQLWNNCGDHNMLRCAIISCFVHIVQGVGSFSVTLHASLLPMIAICTDVSQPPHVYLLEDGLDLWWAIIDNVTTCTPELLNLASNLLPLIECNRENLRICLHIVEGYIILGKEIFVKRYGHDLVTTFLSVIRDLKDEGIHMIVKVLDIAFLVFPEEGPLLFQPLLPCILNLIFKDNEESKIKPISLTLYISLFARVILHNQSCFEESKIKPIYSTLYITLFARVILHNQSCFVSVLQQHANKTQKDVNTVLGELFDVWLNHVLLINPQPREKLSGLALACLLTSGAEIVHDRICGIFLSIVQILNDLSVTDTFTEKQSAHSDLLTMRPDDYIEKENGIGSEHDKRKREFYKRDPVYTVVLRNYFRNQVIALQQSVGAAKFEDLMSTVDIETMQQVQKYLQN